MAKQLRQRGRPRTDRVRYIYKVNLENVVIDRLQDQSATAGDRPTTYLERVIGLAHGYESRYIPPLVGQPLADRVDTLRRHVASITPEQCGQVVLDLPRRHVVVRLDDALGDRVDSWCREHDVTYGGYLRSVLRLAAGFESEDEIRPSHVQPELPVGSDMPIEEGRMPRAG